MTILTKNDSRINYSNFLWHAIFLALASSLMDIDTVLPFTLSELGGKAFQMGVLVSVMLGTSSFSQIIFAPFIQNKRFKKTYLLIGINTRILALTGLALLFIFANTFQSRTIIWMFILLISLFSFSGAFANISYVDLMGKTVREESRKKLLSMKQVLTAIGLFISALIAKKILSYFSAPFSFTILFFFAALFLAIASLGFWKIKETKTDIDTIKSIKQFIKLIISHLKRNKKLRNYLLAINTAGITLTLMPFLVLYGTELLSISKSTLGTLLIFKVTGGVLTGLFLFRYSKRFSYGTLFYAVIFISTLLPLLAVLSAYWNIVFYAVFFLGGILLAIYVMTISGILLEISDNKNRALFTGLTGVGSIIPALFPLVGSWIIQAFSFYAFFGVFIIINCSAIIFIHRLDCNK